MATNDNTYINQVPIAEYKALRIAYTSKDYTNILEDLINSIEGITQKWSTTDINDVGMILVKMMSIVGDLLFYNLDMQALEVYPSSVTQRKNASTIYKLIGYKMRWYKSATVQATMINTYSYAATVPRFCTFTNEMGTITYTFFGDENRKSVEVRSNTTNNGIESYVELVEGTPVTPNRNTNNPYPKVGLPWHHIYNYNYTADDVKNNKIYLKHQNVDQDHIVIIDDQGEEWTLKENIYLTTDTGKYFQFDVDVNDNPYLELVNYWTNFEVTKFKVFYIRSSGEAGQIYANTLNRVTGNVWSLVPTLDGDTLYSISNYIKFTHYDSTYGYDPETPDEARRNSAAFINTLDTIITLADFERAVKREPFVANVRATDLTNDPGIEETYYLGDINMDGTIDENDYTLLKSYITDPLNTKLTDFQLQLADVNMDGVVDQLDLDCLDLFVHPTSPQEDTPRARYPNGIYFDIGDVNLDQRLDQADVTRLREIVADLRLLDQFRIHLADINEDGRIDANDLLDLNNFINSTMWDVGDINEDGRIDPADYNELKAIVDRIQGIPNFVIRLADCNQDGKVTEEDAVLLSSYVEQHQHQQSPFGSLIYSELTAGCGVNTLSYWNYLEGFAVRLYVLPIEEYDDLEIDETDESFDDIIKTEIETNLRSHKILPLDIDIRLHDIKKYYWTIYGTFYMKEPLERDELQDIIVAINNKMHYNYSREKTNFNTLINYKEIIETILSVDDRILMVDLDPIEYFDWDHNAIDKQDITAVYKDTIPILTNSHPAENLKYNITLEKTPILPGSVMIRVNDGEYTLKDNGYGEIYNTDNILAHKGTINYTTGEMELEFVAVLEQPLIINYRKNVTTIALYRNLSTRTFYFDESSLKDEEAVNYL